MVCLLRRHEILDCFSVQIFRCESDSDLNTCASFINYLLHSKLISPYPMMCLLRRNSWREMFDYFSAQIHCVEKDFDLNICASSPI